MVAAAPAATPRLPPKPTSRSTSDLATFRDCLDCPQVVVLPAGTFWMGSDAAETDGEGLTPTEAKREQPRHRVTVGKFAIEKYPVTVGEYRKFVEYRKSTDPTDNREGGCAVGNPMRWDKTKSWRDPGFPQDDNHPVVCVSWQDAQDYAAWLSELAGHRYRLPTEAEWEYAARGNQKTSRFWGNDMVPGKTNCDGCGDTAWDNKGSAPVRGPDAIYPANAFGLYSTIGNVFQWVEDCWTESYEAADLEVPKCEFRVQRGGSWLTYAKKTRAAYRTRSEAKWRGNYIGFRLATDLP
jgi:formylglycine-generating enzyme required for sulfatase activity